MSSAFGVMPLGLTNTHSSAMNDATAPASLSTRAASHAAETARSSVSVLTAFSVRAARGFDLPGVSAIYAPHAC